MDINIFRGLGKLGNLSKGERQNKELLDGVIRSASDLNAFRETATPEN